MCAFEIFRSELEWDRGIVVICVAVLDVQIKKANVRDSSTRQ